jgi:hypothetical protein
MQEGGYGMSVHGERIQPALVSGRTKGSLKNNFSFQAGNMTLHSFYLIEQNRSNSSTIPRILRLKIG